MLLRLNSLCLTSQEVTLMSNVIAQFHKGEYVNKPIQLGTTLAKDVILEDGDSVDAKFRRLKCNSNGELSFKGKNVVRSVNGVEANEIGNVTVDTSKFMPDYSTAVTYPITLTEQTLVIPYDCLLNFDSAGFDSNYCTLYVDNSLIIKRTTNSDQYVMSCNYSGYVKKGSAVKYKSGYSASYASTNLLTLFKLN